MELEERAEEVLETLWIRTEEERQSSLPLTGFTEKEALDDLQTGGYISVADGQVRLTDRGRPLARDVVRRHRLAERLLADVLGTGERLMDEKACKFEHLLDHGLDESICSLLGHPKVCPHGKPIPPGRCCQRPEAPSPKLVSPLSQLAPGQKGKVAYIYAPELIQLQKLVAMGILPGAPISLVQSFPSYVFQVGQTQFAVDKEIAEAIYVRLMETEAAGEPGGERHQRWRRGKIAQRLGLRWPGKPPDRP